MSYYCIKIWGKTVKNVLIQFTYYKTTIRIITKTNYRDPSKPLFIKLKILKLYDLVNFNILTFMCSVNMKFIPPNLMKIKSNLI